VLFRLEEIILIVLRVLVNVALITLLERKVLSIRQFRVGPNKIGAYGFLQPVADAVKLFSNRKTVLGPINGALFILSPVVAMFLIIRFTPLITFTFGALSTRYGLFIILILLSLNVYPLMGSGWASNRKYAFLGGLRAAAQTISYEISLAFIILSIVLLWGRMSLIRFISYGGLTGLILPGIFILLP